MHSPTSPEDRGLDVRVDGPSGTIVLHRPSRRNALSRNLTSQIVAALEDLHQQPGVRAVIVTGAGTAFCSGSDLTELLENRESSSAHAEWFSDVNALRDLFLTLLGFPKPVIAAVNGPAMGTCMGLAMACDLVVSCPEATFGFPEPLRGLTAGIAVPLLSFRIGAGRASQMLLRKDPLSAEEAYRIGLVQELTPHPLLWARSHELAGQIAQLAPESVALTKRVLNETVGEQLATQLSAAAAATATARTTDASEEGIRAFLEKRPPDWSRRS